MTPQDVDMIRQIFREELRAALLGVQPPPPPQISDPAAHLIALAKIDPRASIAEAKRLAREDTLRRREEKKRTRAGA